MARNMGTVSAAMKDFWNRKASENPHYYISTFQDYSKIDEEEFLAVGRELALTHLQETPYTPSKDQVMLEIGCGIGRMTETFAELFGEVWPIDVSEEMIEKARARLKTCTNVFPHVSNGIDLSLFDDEKFDFVYSYLVFQHLPSPDLIINYVQEVGRVLKPKGVFRFQVRTHQRRRLLGLIAQAGWSAHDVFVRAFRLSAPTELSHPAFKGSVVDVQTLVDEIKSAGMEIIKIIGAGTPVTWITCEKVRSTTTASVRPTASLPRR